MMIVCNSVSQDYLIRASNIWPGAGRSRRSGTPTPMSAVSICAIIRFREFGRKSSKLYELKRGYINEGLGTQGGAV